MSAGNDEARLLYGRRLCEWAMDQDEFIELDNALSNVCESPIERLLLVELLFAPYGYGGRPRIVTECGPSSRVTDDLILIVPQHEVGEYRLDFAMFVRWQKPAMLRIAVECDGHDFHERTKEQAAHDKRRDRAITAAGWICLRFTGSEIFHHGQRCAQEIAAYVEKWCVEQERGDIARLTTLLDERMARTA